MKENLYIYTEENPKKSSVQTIISAYATEQNVFVQLQDDMCIVPVIEDNVFKHIYEVCGVSIEGIEHVYCVIFSGCSSTIDFMIFKSSNLPNSNDTPIMLIEETKTNDAESGNAVYQRIIKFVYAKQYYPMASLYMLYNEEYEVNNNRSKVSSTNIFGTRLMLTMGIKILGRKLDNKIFRPYPSMKEFIEAKNNCRFRSGQTSLFIKKEEKCIKISALLSNPRKKGNMCHDPNIGYVAGVSYVIREIFKYEKPIIIINHGVSQKSINRARNNKLLSLSSILNISFENIDINYKSMHDFYWSDKKTSEKYGSIFMDKYLSINGYETIYENHAGCERSYFKTDTIGYITFPKQINGETFFIPDFISLNREKKIVYLIEAKQIQNIDFGIEELNNYDIIEKYINSCYNGYKVFRYVCLYGGNSTEIINDKVGFIMSSDGHYSFNKKFLI